MADSDMNTAPVSAPIKMSSSASSLEKSIPSLLRSVVNIDDFELVASQKLPARSFACKYH